MLIQNLILQRYTKNGVNKKGGRLKDVRAIPDQLERLFLASEEVLGLVSLDKLLSEDIGSGLRRLVHTDALHHALCASLSGERSNCFLCHNLISFI